MEVAWINCSCFYPVKAWDKLFRELSSVLQTIQCLETYDIEMNTQFGENVRLSLLIPKTFHHDVITDVDTKLTCFFDSNFLSSINGEVKMPNVPFPTSIVQFGLYYKNNYINSNNLDKHRDLSDCLLAAFQDVEVSYDTIVALSCYLHFCLLQVCLKFTTIEFLIELFSDYSKHKGLETLVDNNEIADLFFEIENEACLKLDYKWLYDWKSKLITELNLLTENVPADERTHVIQKYYRTNSLLIRNKLNINITFTNLAEYLIGDFVMSYFGKDKYQQNASN